MANRTSRFGNRTVVRRGTFWGRSPANTGLRTLAAGSAVIEASAVPVIEGETIIRTRGFISVKSDQTGAVENGPGALGFCVVSNEAFAAGVGALPTPFTDQDSDIWMVHQYFNWDMESAGATVVVPQLERFEFDSKAMRKMENGSTLAVMIENGSGGAGLSYYIHFAVLFKVN